MYDLDAVFLSAFVYVYETAVIGGRAQPLRLFFTDLF